MSLSVQVPSPASVPCVNSTVSMNESLDPRELLCGLFRLCRTLKVSLPVTIVHDDHRKREE